jgi:hypothetical protein
MKTHLMRGVGERNRFVFEMHKNLNFVREFLDIMWGTMKAVI